MFGSGKTFGQNFQKSILIILFLFLTVSLIITWNAPSTGFESSIYHSTPLVLWIALISSITVGVIFVILSVAKSNFISSNLWKYGLLLISLCYAICLGLFIIRGYYMWGMIGDPASHLGWIYEILQGGHIPPSLFYPAMHIFLSEISLVTTLNPVFLHKIIPLFFSLLCVVFIYIFVRVLSSDHIQPVIAVIIACTFFGGHWYLSLTPNILCDLLVPLALFLMFKYFKSYNVSWGLAIGIILILFPLFHVIPSIFLGLVLLTLWIPLKLHDIWNVFIKRDLNLLNLHRINIKAVIPFLILMIWSIFWYSAYSQFRDNIIEIYRKISEGSGPSYLTGLTTLAGASQTYGYNVIEIILRQYGNPIDLFILSVMTFPLLWIAVSRKEKQENFFSLYGAFGVLCIILPGLYLFKLTFDPLRFIFFIGLLGTVFTAYLVTYILTRSPDSKRVFLPRLTKIVVVVLLVGLSLVGLLNLYPSPYNLTYTSQTTHSEVSGMIFFLEYRNVTIPVSGITQAPGRFADLLLTPEKKSVQNLDWYLRPNEVAPWHFGYDQFPSSSFLYDRETNLIITQRDKAAYTDYAPDMAKYRFFSQDFERLKNDSGANLIYSNGGFDLLTIVP